MTMPLIVRIGVRARKVGLGLHNHNPYYITLAKVRIGVRARKVKHGTATHDAMIRAVPGIP